MRDISRDHARTHCWTFCVFVVFGNLLASLGGWLRSNLLAFIDLFYPVALLIFANVDWGGHKVHKSHVFSSEIKRSKHRPVVLWKGLTQHPLPPTFLPHKHGVLFVLTNESKTTFLKLSFCLSLSMVLSETQQAEYYSASSFLNVFLLLSFLGWCGRCLFRETLSLSPLTFSPNCDMRDISRDHARTHCWTFCFFVVCGNLASLDGRLRSNL